MENLPLVALFKHDESENAGVSPLLDGLLPVQLPATKNESSSFGQSPNFDLGEAQLSHGLGRLAVALDVALPESLVAAHDPSARGERELLTLNVVPQEPFQVTPVPNHCAALELVSDLELQDGVLLLGHGGGDE